MMNEQQAYQALEALTSSDEYKALSKEAQQQKLFDLAKDISVDTTGSKTVLYSGKIDGKKTGDIVLDMFDADPNVRIINISTYLYM